MDRMILEPNLPRTDIERRLEQVARNFWTVRGPAFAEAMRPLAEALSARADMAASGADERENRAVDAAR